MRKLFWGSVFTLAFFIGVHLYAKYLASYEQTVGLTIHSIEENDEPLFYESVHVTPVDEKEANRFFRYVRSTNFEQMKKEMKTAAETVVQEGRMPVIIMHEDGTPLFVISKKKKLGIYDYAAIDLPQDNNIVSALLGAPREFDNREVQLERAVIENREIARFHVKDHEREEQLYVVRANEKSDETYQGQIELYLMSEKENYGILQPLYSVSERIFRAEDEQNPFSIVQLRDATVLLYNANQEIELLAVYQQGRMHEVDIEGDTYMQRMKQLDDETLQGYMHHEQNDAHYFFTWHWDAVKRHFRLLDERICIDADMTVEERQSLERWLTDERYDMRTAL